MARVLSNSKVNELGLWKQLVEAITKFEQTATVACTLPPSRCILPTGEIRIVMRFKSTTTEFFLVKLNPIDLRVYFQSESIPFDVKRSFGVMAEFLKQAIEESVL